jgi:zinc protease
VRAPSRSVVPPAGPVRSFDFPDVHAEALDNGLRIRSVRVGRLPVVTALVVLDAGEGLLDPSRAGLSVLTGDCLEGGTVQRSGVELAEALESIGAGLSIGTGWDSTTVSLSCMADRLDDAMSLLAEVLLQPAFPDDEVERIRVQRLAAIRQREMDPVGIATTASRRLTYAEGVPYGRPLGGTAESVGPFSPDFAAGFVAARYRPKGSGLVVVGDVDAGQVRSLGERHFGEWTGGAERPPEIDAEPRTRERRIVVVDRVDAVQSEIRIGHVGQARSTPHYFPLRVLNTVLGGAFTSRLNLNLREKHGFTYGIRSRFLFRRGAGPWCVSAAVGTDVTADAVREAVTEITTMVAEGPTEEEVGAARDYLAGVFPLQLETTGQIAARIAELLIHDLPGDYFARYRERIRSVTLEGAHEAARQCIRPDEMTVAVGGDAGEIQGPLEEIGWGPVTVEAAS